MFNRPLWLQKVHLPRSLVVHSARIPSSNDHRVLRSSLNWLGTRLRHSLTHRLSRLLVKEQVIHQVLEFGLSYRLLLLSSGTVGVRPERLLVRGDLSHSALIGLLLQLHLHLRTQWHCLGLTGQGELLVKHQVLGVIPSAGVETQLRERSGGLTHLHSAYQVFPTTRITHAGAKNRVVALTLRIVLHVEITRASVLLVKIFREIRLWMVALLRLGLHLLNLVESTIFFPDIVSWW